MTTTWTVVNKKLDVLLDDPEDVHDDGAVKRPAYGEVLRIESWNWAQDILCLHTPRQCKIDLTILGGNREAAMPAGWFAISGIYDATEEQWWTPMDRRPGYHQADDETGLEYWVWDDRLYLQDSVSDRTLTLYYWAYWPKIEHEVGDNVGRDDTPVYEITYKEEQIITPRWAEMALAHLTCANCMVPGAVESSDLGQWKVWIDAGNPNHNPRLQQVWFHIKMYDNALARMPPAFNRRDTWQ